MMDLADWLYRAAACALLLLCLRFCILPLLPRLLSALLPFMLALLYALAVLHLSRRLSARLGLRVETVGVILTVLAIAISALLALFLARWALCELAVLASHLSGEGGAIGSFFSSLAARAEALGLEGETVKALTRPLFSLLTSLLTSLGESLYRLLGYLPGFAFFLVISTISAIYLVLWLPNATRLLPDRVLSSLRAIRRLALRGALLYLRAYAILFCLTLALSLVGMLLLGVRYPLLLALVLALVDLLPILGVGVVLVPWSLLSLSLGRLGLGFGLLALWLAVTILRRILEDRLIGRSIGVHPLLVLFSICLGTSLLGGVGLIVGPLVAAGISATLRARSKKAASNADGIRDSLF